MLYERLAFVLPPAIEMVYAGGNDQAEAVKKMMAEVKNRFM